MIDQAPQLPIQHDMQQLLSINEFTDSLVKELQYAVGSKPSKALMRELLSKGVNRALDLGGAEAKRRFLEALRENLHKFPLQEQRSLSKVYPVEISSEYGNLASFVGEDSDDEVMVVAETKAAPVRPAPRAGLPPPMAGNPVCHAGLEDLRRRLAALPAVPGPAADALLQRLLDEQLERMVRDSDEKRRAAFFSDLRLNLFKLSESGQKMLLDRFSELKADVARLVESMSQEFSRWLDEEKIASQRGNVEPLLTKLKALFKATLSVPFLATFKLLDSRDKRGKEGFLLRVALCLRTCISKHFAALPELSEQVAQLRKQFFYVGGYGELMEEWLNSRISECNDSFEQGATTVLSKNLSAVLQRFRRTFKHGRWVSLTDSKLVEDLHNLFADKSFPKHVVTTSTIAKVLRKASSYGAGDFHIYGDIVRLAPQAPSYFGPPAQDAIDAAVIALLQRLPAFSPLRKLQPGIFLFGRIQVQFVLLGDGSLVARTDGVNEALAEQFFVSKGPEEFPNATAVALDSLLPHGPPSTTIEMNEGAPPCAIEMAIAGGGFPPAPPLPATNVHSLRSLRLLQQLPPMSAATSVLSQPLGMDSGPVVLDIDGADGPPMAQISAPMPLPVHNLSTLRALQGYQRYEPYPATQAPPPSGLVTSSGLVIFGLDDDEI